ncbi:MAG: HPr family phosphocarrier protein [Lachnospiraceae bacterium]
MKRNINLSTIEEANRFVYAANRFAGDIDIKIGRYTLDAKSLMGVLSMAVGRTGELNIIGGEEDQSALDELLAFCN